MIGSENSHHPLSQSDLILKPIMFFQSVLHSLALIFFWMWFHDVLSKTLWMLVKNKKTSICFHWLLALLKTKMLWINRNLPSTYEKINNNRNFNHEFPLYRSIFPLIQCHSNCCLPISVYGKMTTFARKSEMIAEFGWNSEIRTKWLISPHTPT